MHPQSPQRHPWQETGQAGQQPRPYLPPPQHQPWPAQQPYGTGQVPPPPSRKVPWFRWLVGTLAITAALVALMVMISQNATPDFNRAQGRDVCALLLGGRTVDQVAEIAAKRFDWTLSEARNVAKEMQSRGCKP